MSQQGTAAAGESEDQEVSVLRDVLDELDKERAQRAELELRVKSLLSNESEKPAAAKETGAISRQEWIALKTEKEGLVELLDALLKNSFPAFQQAADKQTSTSLPLHALRLLEIMPWDPRARQHAIGKEELYEWQYYNKQRNEWVKVLRQMPQHFRNLPVVQPKPGRQDEVQRKRGLFGDAFSGPPKHVVLTNEKVTCVVNMNDGIYPLPQDGTTWEWIAGWRIDRHVDATEKERRLDSDDQGWSYAVKPSDFSVRELCFDQATNEKGQVIRPYRRRKWARKRVLVSYPNASQPTLEYLRLLAENMRLGVSVTKLCDQLAQTKTALTEQEATLLETKEEKRREEERLRSRLKKAEELLRELGLEDEIEVDKKDNSSLLDRADSFGKEQAEKIQKVWRQSPWNGSNKGDDNTTNETDQATNASESDLRFDWKRIARGPFTPARSPPQTPKKKAALSLEENKGDEGFVKVDEAG